MKKYRIGYVQGTFDMFHIGHLLLIQRAAVHCEQLLVGVVSDEFNLHNKGRLPCIPYEDRAAIVGAIRDVSNVIKIEKGEGVICTWKKHPYDCYFSGDDHLGADFIENMKKHGIDVVLFPYTKRVSSTKLREHKKGEENGIYQKPKEILFLPYKAAMWDSMESVWQAASKDSTCNTVVMPIPYAELDDERNIRAWNWDGDMFPDNVPVVDWHNYDIEKHRPDVIYIHNPYDDGNRITMVEPRFFSRNLRKYTDMLVYIPYFAWTGFWPPNHLALPCYNQVDKIIVQCPEYFTFGQNGVYENNKKTLSEMMPLAKLVALGSPKLDRMHNIMQDKSVLAEWKVKIGQRKTVFLNATVAPLMTYGRRWMAKLWQTYHTISRQEDVVTIFRPHPLIMTMMKSKYPEFIDEYKKWRAAMEVLPQVIIDNNADLEKTVAVADAYMGETSSVVQLFAMQGKPIFYQDMLLGEAATEEECNLAASAMLTDGEIIYFWAEYWNILCAYNTISDKLEVLYQDRPSVYAFFNYTAILKVDEHLVLVPNSSCYILDYNLQTGEAVKIQYCNPLSMYNFGHALVYNGKVLMFGNRQPVIIDYDIESKSIKCCWHVPEEILANRTEGHDQLLGKPCCVGDTIYIPVVNANQVIEWHPESNEYHIHSVGDEAATYGFACEYAGNIWLAPWLGGPITVWHPPTGIVQNFDQFPRGFSFDNMPGIDDTFFFVDTLKCENYWYLLPYCGNMILRLDFNTGNIEKVDLGFELTESQSKHYQQIQNVWSGTVCADKVFIWTGADRMIHCLQGETKAVINSYKVYMEDKAIAKCRHPLGREDFYENPANGQVAAFYEDGVSTTQDAFFAYVKRGKHDYEGQKKAFAKLTANADGTCGIKIHQYIMKELADKRGEANGAK